MGGVSREVSNFMTGGASKRNEEAAMLATRDLQSLGVAEDDFISRIRSLAGDRANQLQAAPSVAQMATNQGIDMATRQAMAGAASQRGISPGLSGAIASRGIGMMGVDAIARGSVAQAEEKLMRDQQAFDSQVMAEDMYKQILGARRGTALQQQSQARAADGQLSGKFGDALVTIGAAAAGGGSGGKFQGGLVEGEAVHEGDAPANDFVSALLSPGEMVVPRTVVKQGPKAIQTFAKQLLANVKKDKAGV